MKAPPRRGFLVETKQGRRISRRLRLATTTAERRPGVFLMMMIIIIFILMIMMMSIQGESVIQRLQRWFGWMSTIIWLRESVSQGNDNDDDGDNDNDDDGNDDDGNGYGDQFPTKELCLLQLC